MKHVPGYRAWRLAGGNPLVLHASADGGVGTELSRTLARFGLFETAACKCKERARRMDNNGIVWCIKNRQSLLGWLRKEAMARRIYRGWTTEAGMWLLVAWAITAASVRWSLQRFLRLRPTALPSRAVTVRASINKAPLVGIAIGVPNAQGNAADEDQDQCRQEGKEPR